MKKLVLGLAGASALSGCLAIPPQGISPEMRVDYLTAVASIGCVMRDESDYQPVELQAGLTREQAVQLTQYYLANGKAVKLQGGGAKFVTEGCV
ncbi:hypothetical protein [Rhodalgimonas zhirmunskyi]|uniref:Uncharacterized protein n=1 Tax=Rhodalgimonas zhirmunskyi TaxID=2964767 RepID=A0AAJ1X762_9RHOB|nr:hypothetical protein [Rhodoalgimonas zhirmunskyi]MDQ2095379.1 hypothetical protein [Rhodoalgimonas zhirmunskyi]